MTLVDELAVEGPAAPPRANGELVFESPWESRVFGLAVSLADQGAFTMTEFQHALIAAIGDWEALGKPRERYHYYECWLAALERLVESSSATATSIADVDARAIEYLARPAGHDHDHDHDHDHGHDHDDHPHRH